MLDLSRARDRMVDVQIARRGVRDRHVLDAVRGVPREAFVEPGFEEFAYEDSPLPIGEGQTISQPFIVAFMIEAAGGPEAPQALKEQLAIGGRLIIPVGEEERRQTLRKIVRRSETEYEEE